MAARLAVFALALFGTAAAAAEPSLLDAAEAGDHDAALDLPHRVEIVVDGRAIRAAQRGDERVRIFADAVEQAARFRRDGLPLGVRVALTE